MASSSSAAEGRASPIAQLWMDRPGCAQLGILACGRPMLRVERCSVDLADFRALPHVGTSLSEDCELDVALADDRDATDEAQQLAALVGRPGPLRVVELFAGGGYHGRALAALGHEVHYVEASAAMKRYMVEEVGLPAQRYHLARLPSWPVDATPPFDLVLLARFSADYLSPAELDALATRLATVLRPGGVWAVELQDRRSVANGHRDLGIRVRETTLPGRRAVLEFPDAEVLVEPARADRPPVLWQSLTLTVTGPTGTERSRYAHWEYFYDRSDLESVPAIARHFEVLDVDVSAAFPQSNLVPLRRR
jgi:Methyltransferase domain